MGPQQLKDADDPFENKIDEAMWLCNKWSRRATSLGHSLSRYYFQVSYEKRNKGDICQCQVWTGENKIRRKWVTGQQWLLQVCSKRLLLLCFAKKKENATHSQLSSEIQSGEKSSLYYLIYLSRLRASLFSISLSPSIVNSSCKLSKCIILLKKIFEFNFK